MQQVWEVVQGIVGPPKPKRNGALPLHPARFQVISIVGVHRCTKVFQTLREGAIPSQCSNMTNWDNIPFRQCRECGKDIKKNVLLCVYKKKKYCDRHCQASGVLRIRYAKGWKSPAMLANRQIVKPSLEELNGMFSRLKNYTAMARELEISTRTIFNWMPNKKILLHPNLLYKEEKLLGTRKLDFENGSREEYYRKRYLEVTKKNPKEMEKRRIRAKERARRLRKKRV